MAARMFRRRTTCTGWVFIGAGSVAGAPGVALALVTDMVIASDGWDRRCGMGRARRVAAGAPFASMPFEELEQPLPALGQADIRRGVGPGAGPHALLREQGDDGGPVGEPDGEDAAVTVPPRPAE